VIHAVVISADAFTIPVFAVAAWCLVRLAEGERPRLSCVTLGLVLTLGLFLKYTVVGLLPPAALVLGLTLWKRPPASGRISLALAGGLALALPAAVFLWEMDQSNQVKGVTTYGHWRVATEPVVMRWQDILLLKPSDRKLLDAPEYFRDELYGHRAYSYAGLLHTTAFTDSQNYFQEVPDGMTTGLRNRNQDDLVRQRTPLSHRLQVLSVRWTLPLSALALAGTVYCGLAFIPSLLLGRGGLNASAAILTGTALSVYAPIFLSFTRLGDPYTAGYWLPRLVLPALLVFFCLGFVLLDTGLPRLARWPRLQALLPRVVLAHVLIACGLFAGFLA
jgi:4-amino-4-deoxy-L-arabinose transferase-like glycosyltransferase